MVLRLLLCQRLQTDQRLLLHQAVLQFDLVQQLIQQLQSLGRQWLVQDLQSKIIEFNYTIKYDQVNFKR